MHCAGEEDTVAKRHLGFLPEPGSGCWLCDAPRPLSTEAGCGTSGFQLALEISEALERSEARAAYDLS